MHGCGCRQLSSTRQHQPSPAVPLSLPPLRRLYRDSTQYVGGKHVRDLSKLNRDMRQVLFITADPDAFALQPENAIKVGARVDVGGWHGLHVGCRHASDTRWRMH